MKLCLLVSRRCNLRCGFCKVNFTGQDMTWDVASRGIDHFLSWVPSGERPIVKFFGGEPLLNWEVVREVVEQGRERWKGNGMKFELATNGSFMDAEKAAYFRDRPEVEITFSFPAAEGPRLPGAWFTLVIDRECDPIAILAQFHGLWRAGWRRFNFLPTYYLTWTEPQLTRLHLTLTALARVVVGFWAKGLDLRVKNLELFSPIPLCNDAATVDVDGSMYASNLIQLEGLETACEALRFGHVLDRGPITPLVPSPELLQDLMRRWSGNEAWRSTRQVDDLLTEFVDTLEKDPCQSQLVPS